MFEDRTYENITAEMLAMAPKGVDTRQGSIYFDAIVSAAFKLAAFYADLSTVFNLVFLSSAVGEYLDDKGAEFRIYRIPATTAWYKFSYEGIRPPVGSLFFTEGQYFVTREHEGKLYLECKEPGTEANYIEPGTPAIPLKTASGLLSATFGEIEKPGAAAENDENFRQRLREKLSGPAENGNRQHYKTWCEEVADVGRARIIPLFAGENTVMGVIIGHDGLPAVDTVVERVQEHIDPITKGLQKEYNGKMVTVGDGLGNGVANVGAHFAAVAAEPVMITVAFDAVLSHDAQPEQFLKDASNSITQHFKELALNAPDNEKVIVRISTIGALLYALPSIIDYSKLTLNGASANIEIETTQAAVLEEVLVNASVR